MNFLIVILNSSKTIVLKNRVFVSRQEADKEFDFVLSCADYAGCYVYLFNIGGIDNVLRMSQVNTLKEVRA